MKSKTKLSLLIGAGGVAALIAFVGRDETSLPSPNNPVSNLTQATDPQFVPSTDQEQGLSAAPSDSFSSMVFTPSIPEPGSHRSENRGRYAIPEDAIPTVSDGSSRGGITPQVAQALRSGGVVKSVRHGVFGGGFGGGSGGGGAFGPAETKDVEGKGPSIIETPDVSTPLMTDTSGSGLIPSLPGMPGVTNPGGTTTTPDVSDPVIENPGSLPSLPPVTNAYTLPSADGKPTILAAPIQPPAPNDEPTPRPLTQSVKVPESTTSLSLAALFLLALGFASRLGRRA